MSVGRLLLIGMMGAGKSTIGHIVAARLGWRYMDSDEEVFRRTGRTVPEIWHSEGEAAFRVEEARVLAAGVSSPEPTVVAVAGGAVLSEANRRVIASAEGPVVWLRVSVDTLVERVGDGAGRPLLEGDVEGNLGRLYAQRRPLYESLADVTIDVDGLAPDVVAERVMATVTERGRPGEEVV